MTPILAFDIETIPDCAGIRRLYALPEDLDNREVAEIAFQKRRVQSGSDFLPPYLHRVLVISCVLRDEEGLKLFSIGEPDAAEPEAIQRFFDGIERYVPQIVSWNGRGFDLPVLVNRGLQHGVRAACFWDTGNDNKDFRWSNYINRFHDRHVDLMDVLSLYGGRGSPLDETARLSGFPGKVGMEGGAVWESYRRGEIAAIRGYCEADCANTYLLFLRFQLMRCAYDPQRYAAECALLRGVIEKRPEPHWAEFLSLWKT
ncbi:MAG TPA: 3'-5' exonuclease [Gammaproteobacteria bacterium]|nr:3'-5' exonuclease [Gammaproteobacteria bacterium]